MNLGYVLALREIDRQKKKAKEPIKELSEILSDLILMEETGRQGLENVKIYTCYETRLFNRYYKQHRGLSVDIKAKLQQEAYFLTKRYIQYKNRYGEGLQYGP